ncbi:MAG TPA: primase-helicase family protein [Phenylobacterium sp.]|uniref:primase-helicase family protein n=1 Tax=Phenylobacterium sp. TaxID=1871053 RepID=UPI002BC90806|nr:primase-helicase family protein [Phenylobacterium sp.]HXA39654.1 primase-helicase family protein [Phenylobacterium sp.]
MNRDLFEDRDDDVPPEQWQEAMTTSPNLQGGLDALQKIESPGRCAVVYDVAAMTKAGNDAIADKKNLPVRLSEADRDIIRDTFRAASDEAHALIEQRGLVFADYIAAVRNGEVVTLRVASELWTIAKVRLPQLQERVPAVVEADPSDGSAAAGSTLTVVPAAPATVVQLRPRGRAGGAAPAQAQQAREYPQAEDAIHAFNKRFAFVRMGSRLMVAVEKSDRVDFMLERDFHSLTDNERVDLDGKPAPISKLWKASPMRRTYENGVTFSPGREPEAGTLNLWRGWGVAPDPLASCELFLNHLADVICRGNETAYLYALGWLAHMVQRPWEKPGVAFVVRGLKGAGKDTAAEYVSRMVGSRHAPGVSDPNQVTGRFNSHLSSALILRVEEAFWAGDHRAEGNLKSLITAPSVFIERKGVDGVSVPNFTRFFISANASWVVPATFDERRFFVLEASEERRGDTRYFGALYAEIEGRGPAALLHYLQNFDLAGFDVRAVPQTKGLAEQKLASLRGLPRWWLERLQEGDLSDQEKWEHGYVQVGREELRDRLAKWLERRRHDGDPLSAEQIGTELRKMLPDLRSSQPRLNGERRRAYIFPSLEECRTAFQRFIGHTIDWGDAVVGRT